MAKLVSELRKKQMDAPMIIRSLLSVLVLTLLSAVSLADVATFNEAMRKGDYPAAAAQTHAVWALLEERSQLSSTLARELAYVNYLAQDYDTASKLMAALQNAVDSGGLNDQQPELSDVLVAMIKFSASGGSRQHKRDLRRSLEKRLASPGIEEISVVAAETLLRSDWARALWKEVATSSDLAVRIYSRAGRTYLGHQRHVEITRYAASFLADPDYASLEQLLKLDQQISRSLEGSSTPPLRLESAQWQTRAWLATMELYFRRTETLPSGHRKLSLAQETPDSCAGELDLGRLRYPAALRGTGLIGTAILSVQSKGSEDALEVEVLADAPPGMFSASIRDSANSFELVGGKANCTVLRTIEFIPNCVRFAGNEECAKGAKQLRENFDSPKFEEPRFIWESLETSVTEGGF